MRATTRFLLLGAFAMCLSACLPQPPVGSGDAAIFKRPGSRYGWGASGRKPSQGARGETQQAAQNRSNSGSSSNSRSGNSFGYTENNRSSNSGSSSQGSSSSSDSSSAPSNSGSSADTTGSSSNDADQGTMADGSGSSESGSSSNSGSSSDSGSSNSSSTPPSNLNSYPYARLVPGKKGFVTLPGANAGVGEIDVTGIKPGTPVEINDPRDPSKKIYFRVP